MSTPPTQLRPALPGDDGLFLALVADARRAELALAATAEQREQLLALQHRAQMAGYRGAHPDAELSVVEVDGVAIGRLFTALIDDAELRVLDIALLPAWRGQGIGERLLRDLFAAADREGRVVSLHVEIRNPARRLYERLGFVDVARDEVHARMERQPGPSNDVS